MCIQTKEAKMSAPDCIFLYKKRVERLPRYAARLTRGGHTGKAFLMSVLGGFEILKSLTLGEVECRSKFLDETLVRVRHRLIGVCREILTLTGKDNYRDADIEVFPVFARELLRSRFVEGACLTVRDVFALLGVQETETEVKLRIRLIKLDGTIQTDGVGDAGEFTLCAIPRRGVHVVVPDVLVVRGIRLGCGIELSRFDVRGDEEELVDKGFLFGTEFARNLVTIFREKAHGDAIGLVAHDSLPGIKRIVRSIRRGGVDRHFPVSQSAENGEGFGTARHRYEAFIRVGLEDELLHIGIVVLRTLYTLIGVKVVAVEVSFREDDFDAISLVVILVAVLVIGFHGFGAGEETESQSRESGKTEAEKIVSTFHKYLVCNKK